MSEMKFIMALSGSLRVDLSSLALAGSLEVKAKFLTTKRRTGFFAPLPLPAARGAGCARTRAADAERAVEVFIALGGFLQVLLNASQAVDLLGDGAVFQGRCTLLRVAVCAGDDVKTLSSRT